MNVSINPNAKLQPAVVITGGSRGIGRALAQAYAKQGMCVVVAARDAGALDVAADGIAALGYQRPVTVPLDITSDGAAAALLAAVERCGFFVDMLINNAGVGLSGPFVDQEPEALKRLVALNVAAVTDLTRAVMPTMIARGRGTIVMMSSLGGAVPGPHQAAYYASKSYVLSLSEALAAECFGTGVRISCVLPGPVNTSFHAAMTSETALYRRLLPQMSEEKLTRLIVRNVALGRRVIAPGVLATFSYMALRILPHSLSVPLMAVLLKNRD
jgi:uncharacterized protein